VFILAALDSSVLPTLGAVDALTIVLSARHPELWPYYAMCSTAGPVCGASVAYRLSRLGILHPSSNHSVANEQSKARDYCRKRPWISSREGSRGRACSLQSA
jgi:membrane protein YqaA with SNARE-associated domain